MPHSPKEARLWQGQGFGHAMAVAVITPAQVHCNRRTPSGGSLKFPGIGHQGPGILLALATRQAGGPTGGGLKLPGVDVLVR
jgi:hypothetical protein